MTLFAQYVNELALFFTFLFGRFSKDGIKKVYFGVRFINELHNLYMIIWRNTKSRKRWVRWSNKVIMYGFILPLAIIVLSGSVYALYWLLQ